jgi:hypothetical protein
MNDKPNNYIRLFSRLSKLPPSQEVLISEVEDLGFFLSDIERLHEEGFIFINQIVIPRKKGIIKYYIKLAPRGFANLENYLDRIERKENDRLLRDNGVVLMQVAVLGIIFGLFNKIEAFWSKLNPPAIISFLLLFVAGAFIILLITKVTRIIFSRSAWKGLLFDDIKSIDG